MYLTSSMKRIICMWYPCQLPCTKKHVPYEISQHFKVKTKNNLFTIIDQINTFNGFKYEGITKHPTLNSTIIEIKQFPFQMMLSTPVVLYLQSRYDRHHYCALQILNFCYRVTNHSMVIYCQFSNMSHKIRWNI